MAVAATDYAKARSRPTAGTAFLLSIAGLILAALLAEAALRIIGYPMPALLPSSVRSSYHTAPQSQFIYLGYFPGAVEDFANPVRLNRLGFHDHDYAPERPAPSTYRIMVLGDSYVAAWEVPVEETFHKRLETRLQGEDPLGRGSYQVIALGQGRSAQAAELEWLRQYGPVYRPDMVLLVFFCGNDFMENDPLLFSRASEFGSRYVRKVVPRKLGFFDKALWLPHSRLNGLVAQAASQYYAEHLDWFDDTISRSDLESPELGIYRNPLPAEWQTALERTDELLEAVQKATGEVHARFALASLSGPQGMGERADRLLWSTKEDPGFDYGRPERWIESWAERHRVPLMALGPRLANVGRRKVFWRHDQHLNPDGHAVVAEALYPFLTAIAAEP